VTFRDKPGVAFWATVVIVAVLIGYPLSFGPACWVNQRWDVGSQIVSAVYCPVLALASEDGRLPQPVYWYARIGADDTPLVRRGSLVWREREIGRRIAALITIHHGPLPLNPPREFAPEEIRWVDPLGKRVWIGVGEADAVELSTVYRVLKGPPSLRAVDSPQGDHAEEEIIGTIEITHVIEPHLSEARILHQDEKRPIVRGDFVIP
jgi:hypothetical protein